MSQIAVYEEQGTRYEGQGERQKQKKLRLVLESDKAADSDVMLVTTHRIPRSPRVWCESCNGYKIHPMQSIRCETCPPGMNEMHLVGIYFQRHAMLLQDRPNLLF